VKVARAVPYIDCLFVENLLDSVLLIFIFVVICSRDSKQLPVYLNLAGKQGSHALIVRNM